MAGDSIRTLLVEDHEITRLGLRKALESIARVTVVAEAADGNTAVSVAIELQPDLVLMDIGLPGKDGIQATKAIKDALSAKVIMITSHDNEEDIFAALSAGAEAYCLKDISTAQLANAIYSVIDGALWLDPGIAKTVLKQIELGRTRALSASAPRGDTFGLSERENQVLNLLVEGLSNQQIGERLFLSPDTIKTHLCHIFDKLRVSGRTQAAIKAVRSGLFS